MVAISLKVEHLVLDNDNPRITHADSQHQTLQKVVNNQKTKLVKLAESIVEHGLSPIERLMVMEVSAKPKRYIALEGNRRVAALRLLVNPAVMTGLDMPSGMQRSIESLAKIFEKGKVEPIDCYEVGSREEGKYWIELRHNGEDQGRGIVGWKPITAARFRDKEPAIQAFEMVMEHGGFDEDEAENLRSGFSLTTLRRLMESKDVRALIGLTEKHGQLHTSVAGSEIIKPLKRIITDIANKEVDSRKLSKTEQMIAYVSGFGKADKPDLSKKVSERPLDGIQKAEFAKAVRKSAKRRSPSPADRKQLVPKNCPVNVTDNRISEIYEELKTLKLVDSRNAIAVLLRVFLEMSIDHFLESNNAGLSFKTSNGKNVYKKLDKKLAETVDLLVSMNVPRNHFTSVIRSLSVDTSPMNVELLHRYVHERFATPSPQELTAAWNDAQPLFEKIWP